MRGTSGSPIELMNLFILGSSGRYRIVRGISEDDYEDFVEDLISKV